METRKTWALLSVPIGQIIPDGLLISLSTFLEAPEFISGILVAIRGEAREEGGRSFPRVEVFNRFVFLAVGER